MNIKNLMAITITSIAMLMIATISSSITPQQAFAQQGPQQFCTRFTEDGTPGSACFSGEDAHKSCKQFAEEVFGTKCRIISKF
jgi:hypothetical protein